MEKENNESCKMSFDQKEFINFLIEEGCIGFYPEPIKLSSGGESNWYVNLRELQKDFSRLDKYTDFIIKFLKDREIEGLLLGVPEAATLPATEVNRKLGYKSFFYLRKQAKSHGIVPGYPYSLAPLTIKGREVNILEDTLTTGDSAIKTILNAYLGGAKVKSVIVVCYREDRRWGGLFPHEYIEKNLEIPVYTLTRAREVLPLAIEKLKPGKEILEGLREEYKNHEVILSLRKKF